MSTFAKITQLGFAGSLLFTSLYMSLGFNECDCDNARVLYPKSNCYDHGRSRRSLHCV